jgi:hypothetical protein
MFHFPNPANTLVIDNTELLRLFNGAKAEWYEAVRQNAPQQRLDEIIRNARDNLHTEVWRMDRDMNSPVFRDVANVPPHILQAEFDTNFERFNPNVWHPEIGRFRDRDEAPWYRMHSRTTMDRLNEHGVDTRPVNRLGFINRDYDIVRIHDDGLKQYLMSPDNLRRIHEETIWKMTLLNYLAGGRNTHIPFNLRSYPHHRERLIDQVMPWNLHDRVGDLRVWYDRARHTMDDDEDEDEDDDEDDDDDDGDGDDDEHPADVNEQRDDGQPPEGFVQPADADGDPTDDEGDDGYIVGGSIPRAHMALQSLESRRASSIARQITFSRR